jgi:hypothetical protein
MEISLQWLDGQTLLTLTQRGRPSGDIERGHIDRWNEFLDLFVARIQTRSATCEAERRGRAAMRQVTSEISMSIDGFITGPNVRVGNGMGDDGDRLHDWMFDAKTETDGAIVDEKYASTGAILIGKRMFDVGFEPWGDPPPFGMPVFIVTHEAREPLPMQGGTT